MSRIDACECVSFMYIKLSLCLETLAANVIQDICDITVYIQYLKRIITVSQDKRFKKNIYFVQFVFITFRFSACIVNQTFFNGNSHFYTRFGQR